MSQPLDKDAIKGWQT